jgi:anti-sigma factor RsiW
VLQALSEHTEGDLDPSACKSLEEHIASCPPCAARCDGLREVLAACAALPAAPVPEPIAAAIRTGIREALETT